MGRTSEKLHHRAPCPCKCVCTIVSSIKSNLLIANERSTKDQFSSMSAVSSPTSLHSLLLSANFLMPMIRSAHRLSAGVRNVYPRCELMTPIACKTAFLESLPKTAGCLIHSRLLSSSASNAATVRASTLDEALNRSFLSFD